MEPTHFFSCVVHSHTETIGSRRTICILTDYNNIGLKESYFLPLFFCVELKVGARHFVPTHWLKLVSMMRKWVRSTGSFPEGEVKTSSQPTRMETVVLLRKLDFPPHENYRAYLPPGIVRGILSDVEGHKAAEALNAQMKKATSEYEYEDNEFDREKANVVEGTGEVLDQKSVFEELKQPIMNCDIRKTHVIAVLGEMAFAYRR